MSRHRPAEAIVPRLARRRVRRSGQGAVLDVGLASAIGIAALLGLLGTYYFSRGVESSEVEYSALTAIVHEVDMVAKNQSSFDGIDNAFIVSRGHLPAAVAKAPGTLMLGPDGIVDVIAGASPSSTYNLQVTKLAKRNCVHLALIPFARQRGLSINGASIPVPASVVSVEAACKTSSVATIVWTLGA